ncbi:HIT domain-containing protein [Candidatus Saccharibacteria bacterium]|nr:HIT domain-containing protein [Candidatus Saccharibacteria bacterium]
MSKARKCPFCEPTKILEETGLAWLLASDPRLAFGHLLVVPKRHVERPWEMSSDEMSAVWSLIKKYQKLLSEKAGDGCDVRENYRPFLPQSQLKVDHVHWHLIPRTDNDEIYMKSQIGEKWLFHKLGDRELEELKGVL